jgi:hypothetical protein
VSGTIDGAPMVFYGQENGISQYFGFDQYELNFGKEIPQFKKYNSLQPILNTETYGLNQLFPVFSAVGAARQFSAALRSSNRYYLNQTGDNSIQPEIFSVAKYETDSGSPATTDVVFAFANLDRNDNQSGNFNLNIAGSNGNLFGIKSTRNYNFKNIAAYLRVDPNRRNYSRFRRRHGHRDRCEHDRDLQQQHARRRPRARGGIAGGADLWVGSRYAIRGLEGRNWNISPSLPSEEFSRQARIVSKSSEASSVAHHSPTPLGVITKLSA